MDQLNVQPYYASLYDWLIGWNASPAKATVSAPGHDAYDVCYRGVWVGEELTNADPNDWYYLPPGQACQSAYTQYDMPSPALTSDARMITWTNQCP